MIPKYNLQYLDELNVAKKRVLEKQNQQINIQKPIMTDDITIDPVLEDKKNRNKKSDNLLKEINNELENINIEFEVLIASILQETGPGRTGEDTERKLAVEYKKLIDELKKAEKLRDNALDTIEKSRISDLEQNMIDNLMSRYKETKGRVMLGPKWYTADELLAYSTALTNLDNANKSLERDSQKLTSVERNIEAFKHPLSVKTFAVKDVVNSINDVLKKVLIKTTTMKNKVSKNISSSIFYDKYDIQKFNYLSSRFSSLFEDFITIFKVPSDYRYKYSVDKYEEIFNKINTNISEIKRYLVYGKEMKQFDTMKPFLNGSGFTETPKRNYM